MKWMILMILLQIVDHFSIRQEQQEKQKQDLHSLEIKEILTDQHDHQYQH